jgi:hypothetical protein
VVAVLFAAGLYLPSRIKTLAGNGKPAPAPQQTQSVAGPSVTIPPTTTTSTPTPSLGDAAQTLSTPTDPSATTSGGSTGTQAPQSGQTQPDSSGSSTQPADTAPASASGGNSGGGTPLPPKKSGKTKKAGGQQQASSTDTVPAEVDESLKPEEIERRYDEVDSRAAAVSQSLDTLKRQQAAAGYGLRGDIVSAEQRMRTDFSKAQFFMQKQDMKNAKKFLDMGEAELQTIEKFLGH